MSESKLIRLEEIRNNKSTTTTADFRALIEDNKIPMYFLVPEDKQVFTGSPEYLELLLEKASHEEITWYRTRGGDDEIGKASNVDWLRIPQNEYKTLFSNGMCRPRYYFEGLQLTEQGLKSTHPKIEKHDRPKYPFSPKQSRLLMEKAYFLNQINVHSPDPISHLVRLAEILILNDDAKQINSFRKSPQNTPKILPACKYMSSKLSIALQVWSDIWKDKFDITNSKKETVEQKIKEKNISATTLAETKLKEHKRQSNSKESYKNLPKEIAKLIHPVFISDSDDIWFSGAISPSIIAMIEVSNYFWGDADTKEYGPDLQREEVIKRFMENYGIKKTDAIAATMVIQPDDITRGRRKT